MRQELQRAYADQQELQHKRMELTNQVALIAASQAATTSIAPPLNTSDAVGQSPAPAPEVAPTAISTAGTLLQVAGTTASEEEVHQPESESPTPTRGFPWHRNLRSKKIINPLRWAELWPFCGALREDPTER